MCPIVHPVRVPSTHPLLKKYWKRRKTSRSHRCCAWCGWATSWLVSRPRRLGTCPWGHPLTGRGDGGRTGSPAVRPRFIPGSPQSCPRIRAHPSTGPAPSIHRVVPRCGWKRAGSWTQGDGRRTARRARSSRDEPTYTSSVTPISTEGDGRPAGEDHSHGWRFAERPLPDDERGPWKRHADDATPDPIGIVWDAVAAGSDRCTPSRAGVPITPGASGSCRSVDLSAVVRVGAAESVPVRAVTGPTRAAGSGSGCGEPATGVDKLRSHRGARGWERGRPGLCGAVSAGRAA